MSSATEDLLPTCKYSQLNMEGAGYILGNRFRILNYLSEATYYNTSTNGISSVDEFRDMARTYLDPLQMNSLEGITAEENVAVVAKCLNKYCSLCEDGNLTSCKTCWGRFGDPNYSGQCLSADTCSSLNDDDGFKDGCFKTSDDCFACDICDVGYARQEFTGACENCRDFDENCQLCSGQVADQEGDGLRCDVCEIGYGVQEDSGRCAKCEIPDIQHCKFDSTGTESIELCLEGYALSRDGQTCEKHCELGEFPELTLVEDLPSVSRLQCAECYDSCRTCAQQGSGQCLTCKDGKYLEREQEASRIGECVDKVESSDLVQLLVLNADNQDQLPEPDASGGLIQPNLMSAIFKAYELTTTTIGQQVQILMESGSHYIKPSDIISYNNLVASNYWIDFVQPQFSLYIYPLSCSDSLPEAVTSAYASENCYDPDPLLFNQPEKKERVTVFNKAGPLFKIQAPQSLTIDGITFDGLESLQRPDSPSADLAQRDCGWSETDPNQPECSNVDEDDMLIIDKNQICQYRSYDSMLQFRNIERPIETVDQIQTVEIHNSVFQNFFYEIGSIVRLPEPRDSEHSETADALPWKLHMNNNEFRNMSFCGSIVSNDFPTFEGNQEQPYIEDYNTALKKQIDISYRKGPTQRIELDCETEECWSFVFESNTVENLNFLKKDNSQNYFEEKINWQMSKFGLAVHLVDFQGDILIQENQFLNTQLNFNDFCSYHATTDPDYFDIAQSVSEAGSFWTSLASFSAENANPRYSDLIPNQGDAHQLHSLIVIDNLKKDKMVELIDNTFEGNIMTNGLISISQENDQSQLTVENEENDEEVLNEEQDENIDENNSNLVDSRNISILVQGNTFKTSASYYGTNILIITKLDTSAEYNELKRENRCGWGIKIHENTFNEILGSCQTDTGLVRVQCNNTAYAQELSGEPITQREYSFINQSRQIAPSHGHKSFDQADLEKLRENIQSDPSAEALIFTGNTIADCALGFVQSTILGASVDASDRSEDQDLYSEVPQPYTGSLFTFQDIFRVYFSDNTIVNIKPLIDTEFYKTNSAIYKYFNKEPEFAQAPDVNRVTSKSLALIASWNAYDIEIQNCSITSINAQFIESAAMIDAHNGLMQLKIGSSSISNLQPVRSSLFRLSEPAGPERLNGRIIEIQDSKIANVTFLAIPHNDLLNETAESFIFNNFNENLTLSQFQIKNLTVGNITSESNDEGYSSQFSSLLALKSHSISIESTQFGNMSFISNKYIQNGLLKFMILEQEDQELKPGILLNSSIFSNVTFGDTIIIGEESGEQNSSSDSSFGIVTTEEEGAEEEDMEPTYTGLITVQSQSTAQTYDIQIEGTTFDTVKPSFRQPSKRIVASLISFLKPNVTADESSVDEDDAAEQGATISNPLPINLTFYNAAFTDLFSVSYAQLFRFEAPIQQLTLDTIVYTGLAQMLARTIVEDESEESASQLSEDQSTWQLPGADYKTVDDHVVMQELNAESGPQQVKISNSVMDFGKTVDREQLKEVETFYPTALTLKRIIFDVQNYYSAYTRERIPDPETAEFEVDDELGLEIPGGDSESDTEAGNSTEGNSTATDNATDTEQIQRQVEFKAITVKNIDFMDRPQDTAAYPADNMTTIASSESIGTFVRATRSNLLFESVHAQNLLSESSGSFLNVYESEEAEEYGEQQSGEQNDQEGSSEVEQVQGNAEERESIIMVIKDSTFGNCSSLKMGGAIYFQGTQNMKYDTSIQIENTTFLANFAHESSAGIYIDANNVTLSIENSVVEGNIAKLSNSFGEFRNLHAGSITITGSRFEDNEVLQGGSTLTLYDSQAEISTTQFTNNKATNLTNVLRIVNTADSQSQNFTIDTVTFDSSQYYDDNQKQITGSYIHLDIQSVVNDSSTASAAWGRWDEAETEAEDAQTQVPATSIDIRDSSFRMGSANYGGALYFNGSDEETSSLRLVHLNISGATFSYNKADLSGGAIFMDGLDLHQVELTNCTFTGNKVKVYGDNLYFKQTKLSTVPDPNEEEPQGGRRRLQSREQLGELTQEDAEEAEDPEEGSPQIFEDGLEEREEGEEADNDNDDDDSGDLETDGETQDMSRFISVIDSEFTTPGAFNQIYLENIEDFRLEGSIFDDTGYSQALEGGSIYCMDCYRVSISETQFHNQESILRGGAIFFKQSNSTYFGQRYFSEPYTINSSGFTSCQSQQGGCIYMKNIKNAAFTGTNEFSDSRVLRYRDGFTQPDVDSEYEKEIDFFDSQASSGQGAVLYFDCKRQLECSLDLADGTTMSGSKMYAYSAESGGEPTITDTTSIFCTEVLPSSYPSGLSNDIEKHYLSTYGGSNFVIMADPTEYQTWVEDILPNRDLTEELAPLVLQPGQYVEIVDGSAELESLLKTDGFDAETDFLFGPEMPIAILNEYNEIQAFDDYSNMTVEILDAGVAASRRNLQNNNELQLAPIMLTQDPANPNEYTVGATILEVQATTGAMTIPPFKIQAIPGSKIQMKLTGNMANYDTQGFTTILKTFGMQIQECDSGSLIDTEGRCMMCEGPDKYTLDPLGSFMTTDCHRCNTTVFTCNGGDNIASQPGYQRVDQTSDLFVKCGLFGGMDVCLDDNKCAEGYQGFMCQQCAPGHFRDFDGSCSACSVESAGGAAGHVIIPWLILLVVLACMVYVLTAGQLKNQTSMSFHFLKVMINYVILFVLISEVLDEVWLTKYADEDPMVTYYRDYYVIIFRGFYSVPYKSIEAIQCASQSAVPADGNDDFTMIGAQNDGGVTEAEEMLDGYDLIKNTALSLELLMLVLLSGKVIFSKVYSGEQVQRSESIELSAQYNNDKNDNADAGHPNQPNVENLDDSSVGPNENSMQASRNLQAVNQIAGRHIKDKARMVAVESSQRSLLRQVSNTNCDLEGTASPRKGGGRSRDSLGAHLVARGGMSLMSPIPPESEGLNVRDLQTDGQNQSIHSAFSGKKTNQFKAGSNAAKREQAINRSLTHASDNYVSENVKNDQQYEGGDSDKGSIKSPDNVLESKIARRPARRQTNVLSSPTNGQSKNNSRDMQNDQYYERSQQQQPSHREGQIRDSRPGSIKQEYNEEQKEYSQPEIISNNESRRSQPRQTLGYDKNEKYKEQANGNNLAEDPHHQRGLVQMQSTEGLGQESHSNLNYEMKMANNEHEYVDFYNQMKGEPDPTDFIVVDNQRQVQARPNHFRRNISAQTASRKKSRKISDKIKQQYQLNLRKHSVDHQLIQRKQNNTAKCPTNLNTPESDRHTPFFERRQIHQFSTGQLPLPSVEYQNPIREEEGAGPYASPMDPPRSAFNQMIRTSPNFSNFRNNQQDQIYIDNQGQNDMDLNEFEAYQHHLHNQGLPLGLPTGLHSMRNKGESLYSGRSYYTGGFQPSSGRLSGRHSGRQKPLSGRLKLNESSSVNDLDKIPEIVSGEGNMSRISRRTDPKSLAHFMQQEANKASLEEWQNQYKNFMKQQVGMTANGTAQSWDSARGDLFNNQNVAKGDIADILHANEALSKQRNVHHFDRESLALMALAFLINTQLLDKIFMLQVCLKIDYLHFEHSNSNPEHFTAAKNLFGEFINSYDSAVQCGSSGMQFSNFVQVFSIFHFIVWMILGPAYVAYKAGRFYAIEIIGLFTKLFLVIIAKALVKHYQFESILGAAFIITLQLFAFLLLRQQQALGESEKLTNLRVIHQADAVMHVVLCLSCYLGIIQVALRNSDNQNGTSSSNAYMFYFLVLINYVFIIHWIFRVVQLLIRKFKGHPKCATICLIMQCKCFRSQKEIKEEKEEADIKIQKEEIMDQDMKRIDVIIRHLMEKQKEIKRHAIKSREHNKSLDQSQNELRRVQNQRYIDYRKLMKELTGLLDQRGELQDLENDIITPMGFLDGGLSFEDKILSGMQNSKEFHLHNLLNHNRSGNTNLDFDQYKSQSTVQMGAGGQYNPSRQKSLNETNPSRGEYRSGGKQHKQNKQSIDVSSGTNSQQTRKQPPEEEKHSGSNNPDDSNFGLAASRRSRRGEEPSYQYSSQHAQSLNQTFANKIPGPDQRNAEELSRIHRTIDLQRGHADLQAPAAAEPKIEDEPNQVISSDPPSQNQEELKEAMENVRKKMKSNLGSVVCDIISQLDNIKYDNHTMKELREGESDGGNSLSRGANHDSPVVQSYVTHRSHSANDAGRASSGHLIGSAKQIINMDEHRSMHYSPANQIQFDQIDKNLDRTFQAEQSQNALNNNTEKDGEDRAAAQMQVQIRSTMRDQISAMMNNLESLQDHLKQRGGTSSEESQEAQVEVMENRYRKQKSQDISEGNAEEMSALSSKKDAEDLRKRRSVYAKSRASSPHQNSRPIEPAETIESKQGKHMKNKMSKSHANFHKKSKNAPNRPKILQANSLIKDGISGRDRSQPRSDPKIGNLQPAQISGNESKPKVKLPAQQRKVPQKSGPDEIKQDNTKSVADPEVSKAPKPSKPIGEMDQEQRDALKKNLKQKYQEIKKLSSKKKELQKRHQQLFNFQKNAPQNKGIGQHLKQSSQDQEGHQAQIREEHKQTLNLTDQISEIDHKPIGYSNSRDIWEIRNHIQLIGAREEGDEPGAEGAGGLEDEEEDREDHMNFI